MKTIKIFLIAIILLASIFSCAKDDNDIEQDIRKNILVENSPWTYQNYKVIAITERNGSILTEEELEEFIDKSTTGSTLSFNADGTGISKSRTSDLTNTWTWTLNKNEIQSIWNDPKGTISTFKNVEISSSQFKFQQDALNFVDKEGNNIKWYGTYTSTPN